MPELPEVESIVRRLRSELEGRRIASFHSYWPRQCSPSAVAVRRALAGRSIAAVSRRAKFIVLTLDDRTHLLIHLRMSGDLVLAPMIQQRGPHVRAEWRFSDGSRLFFDDARKFGRIIHTTSLSAATAQLGVEPLSRDFTTVRLHGLLASRRRLLKPLLLDQSVIAGLGNIYVDESLFLAGLHPATRADAVSPTKTRSLHAAIVHVLSEAIRRNGTSFDWVYRGGSMQDALAVYGRAGEPCRRCRTPIVAIRMNQRGTHLCPACQPLP